MYPFEAEGGGVDVDEVGGSRVGEVIAAKRGAHDEDGHLGAGDVVVGAVYVGAAAAGDAIFAQEVDGGEKVVGGGDVGERGDNRGSIICRSSASESRLGDAGGRVVRHCDGSSDLWIVGAGGEGVAAGTSGGRAVPAVARNGCRCQAGGEKQ